jgi:putative transposase
MILWSDDGLTVRKIARRTKVTPAAVSNWRKRFRDGRVSGLHDALKSGRPRSLDDEQIAELLNAALLRKPAASTHWTVRGLADETWVAKSSVQLYLKLFGVQPHRSKSFKLSNDPFFIEKVRDIVRLYLNPPDRALVLCVDEKDDLDVHLIVDNYATHKHPKVRAWLARRPRFHLHFTPTYSSWLNQVERWFGIITQRAIRRGSFDSVAYLRRRIEQFTAYWNQHPKPFSWTATADSILEKLTRLSKAISGTAH